MQSKYPAIIILLLTCTLNVFGIDTYQYGLTFNSHQVIQDKRTSLILTPDRLFDLAPGFTMEFDFKLYWSSNAYGYVFRMINADSICLDFTSNMLERKANFILSDIMNVKENIEFKDTDDTWDKYWTKVYVKVGKDSIFYSIGNQAKAIPYSLGDMKKIYLSFGRSRHSFFRSTDVPPMSLRNLVIRNDKGKVINSWSMLEHNGDKVYDSVSHAMAVVENGTWDIDRHRKWNLILSMKLSDEHAQIATDTLNGRVFIADRDTLYVYHINDDRMDRIAVEKGAPFRQAGGSQMIYDNKHNQLISYSIQFPQLVRFDFETRRWSDDLQENLPPIQQHSRFIDYNNNRLIIFGGYGMHYYHSEIYSHDLTSGGWRIDSLSCIAPRYLSALGYLGNDKALIMGGYGSISGKQEEFPRIYCDLYEIDYRNMTCRKLTEFSNQKLFGVYGNSMVIAPDQSRIWALQYDNDKFQSAISIAEMDMKTYTMSVVSDSIPYDFLDIDSYNDFFYYSKTSSLYAVVLNSRIGNKNLLTIHSIAYPPLALKDVSQKGESKASAFFWWIIAATFLAVCAVAGSVYLLLKRTKKKELPEPDKIIIPEPQKQHPVKNQASSIFLLGGFRVLDMEGNDITYKFTVLIKNVFLYILLNFIHNKRWVTSQKLEEVFWFGFDKNESMNSRNVNMHRIRMLLKEIGNINLLHKNRSWYIEMSNDVFCDYKCMFELFDNGNFNKATIEQIVNFASEGALLPDVREEWMDHFKEKYSNSIIEILTNAIRQQDIHTDSKLLLRIADTILLQDDIDEDAIKLKCITLYQVGQKGLSKNCYNNFYESYVKLLKTEPNLKYEDILNSQGIDKKQS